MARTQLARLRRVLGGVTVACSGGFIRAGEESRPGFVACPQMKRLLALIAATALLAAAGCGGDDDSKSSSGAKSKSSTSSTKSSGGGGVETVTGTGSTDTGSDVEDQGY